MQSLPGNLRCDKCGKPACTATRDCVFKGFGVATESRFCASGWFPMFEMASETMYGCSEHPTRNTRILMPNGEAIEKEALAALAPKPWREHLAADKKGAA